MFQFICLVVVLFVVVRAFTCPIRRSRARAGANRIINSEEPATEEKINKTITSIIASKTWGFNLTEADHRLVELLRKLRDNTVKSSP